VLQSYANRLQRCNLRRLYRPTETYDRILSESVAPRCLRDSKTRREFLRRACKSGPTPRRYLPQEVAALAKADVPAIRAKAALLRNYTKQAFARDVTELRLALGANL
jgi:lantibiotic modifying enzyme